jgi:ribosomal protein L18, bacterial type
MSSIRTSKRKIRHLRVRKKISGTPESPRLSIFRSNKFIYAQIVNDLENKTLISCSSKDSEVLKDRTENKSKLSTKNFDAYKVGLVISNKCKKSGIKKVVFDRGGYKYHGRVKALTGGARENGLEF